MNNKGILKFKGKESKGAMHYITYNGNTVTLTMGNSRKVSSLKDQGYLDIAPKLLSRQFGKMEFDIVDDKTYVKEVFDYMLHSKHTHYKKWDDNLVVLSVK